MNLYRVVDAIPTPLYAAVLKEAHDLLKCYPLRRAEARIELVSIPTSKDAIITLLNAHRDGALETTLGAFGGVKVLRTWALSTRTGLKEVPNGE